MAAHLKQQSQFNCHKISFDRKKINLTQECYRAIVFCNYNVVLDQGERFQSVQLAYLVLLHSDGSQNFVEVKAFS